MIKWTIKGNTSRFTTEELFNKLAEIMAETGATESPSKLLTFGQDADRLYKVGETNTIAGIKLERVA